MRQMLPSLRRYDKMRVRRETGRKTRWECRFKFAEQFNSFLWRSGYGCSVAPLASFADSPAMSSVAEIEAAIERLSPPEVNQVAKWLEEYQQMISASAEMFALYDKEDRDHAQG
jgi:hypothetical protein